MRTYAYHQLRWLAVPAVLAMAIAQTAATTTAPAAPTANSSAAAAAATAVPLDTERQRQLWDQLTKSVYAILSENIRQNSRKLKLDDFSWGILGGTKGRLLGLRDYTLAAQEAAAADKSRLRASYTFTVPTLQAFWEKSACMGHACALTIELRNCEFALSMSLDSAECAIDHLAYLRTYGSARSHVTYAKMSPLSVALVESTVRLLSHVLNTKPFEKVITDNVNHALLQLPLFNTTDIRNLCDQYRLLVS